MYGRDLNSVLKDNLGMSWEEARVSLMTKLECLRRRIEDDQAQKSGPPQNRQKPSGVRKKKNMKRRNDSLDSRVS